MNCPASPSPTPSSAPPTLETSFHTHSTDTSLGNPTPLNSQKCFWDFDMTAGGSVTVTYFSTEANNDPVQVVGGFTSLAE